MAPLDKKIAVLVVAAGRGARAGGGTIPKQYRPIGGMPVLEHTLSAFLAHPAVSVVVPIIHPDDEAHYEGLRLSAKNLGAPVFGAETRQKSVLAGLRALDRDKPDYVLIHDGARPFVSKAVISGVIAALTDHQAALPALPLTDTIKRSVNGKEIEGTQSREGLYSAQTPQGFCFSTIRAAHEKAATSADTFTDDASIAEWAEVPVTLCEGDPDNIKITHPTDFSRAEQMIAAKNQTETRVGSGYDIHQFCEGDFVVLGGVRIPHTASLKGHSDADAALHVLTDALLGALAEGDIGTHFPPSDPQWRGEPSTTFLRFAANKVAESKGRIVNLDLTIMCEYPKIGPHVSAIRRSIADICAISEARISVKATTSERMGFIGREEGLATMATAMVEMPRAQE